MCEQYEIVRQDAATPDVRARQGHGLVLLLTRGMPAWLDAVSTLSLPRAQGEHETPARSRGPVLDLPPPVRSEFTRVLASLVLTCAQEGASA